MYVILYAVEHKVVFISQVCDIAFSASRKEKSTFSRGDLTLSTRGTPKEPFQVFCRNASSERPFRFSFAPSFMRRASCSLNSISQKRVNHSVLLTQRIFLASRFCSRKSHRLFCLSSLSYVFCSLAWGFGIAWHAAEFCPPKVRVNFWRIA